KGKKRKSTCTIRIMNQEYSNNKNFKFVKQLDSMQCGVASLQAIIAIVFLALLAAVCLLPYPYSNGESILRHIIG
ncbi:MAG: hypothetical protein K2F76_09100, partial [Duncaniella dubosii]|nr:hypothetical protein [Duncaniella dubosii]